MSQPQRETVTTERVALIVWQLARGRAMTTRQVAAQLDITHSGAWRLLDRASRAVPLYQDADGRWCAVLQDQPPTAPH